MASAKQNKKRRRVFVHKCVIARHDYSNKRLHRGQRASAQPIDAEAVAWRNKAQIRPSSRFEIKAVLTSRCRKFVDQKLCARINK